MTGAFWAFRIMVGVGSLMGLLALLAVVWGKSVEKKPWFLKVLVPSIFLPFIGVTTGWIITETARQPWIVYGLLKTAAGVSPTLGGGTVLFTLVVFTLVIGALILITGALIKHYGADVVTADPSAS